MIGDGRCVLCSSGCRMLGFRANGPGAEIVRRVSSYTPIITSLVSLAIVGGVNHGQSCHPHCRLANFRDLMFRVTYTSMIGRNLALLCESSSVTQVMGNFQPITDAFSPLYIKITEFRQTTSTVRMTVVDPSHVLQKLYDLMYSVKYAAVIGLKTRTL